MAKKISKILFILLVVLGIFVTYVKASDINMNLLGNQTPTDNTVNDPNSVDNTDVSPSNDQNDNSYVNAPSTDDDTTIREQDPTTLQPSTTLSSSEGLSATDIINILLITVGVILILLAIAIMIRLK